MSRRPTPTSNQIAHAAAQKRRERALKLRLWGWTYAAIGKRLGVSQQTACEYVKDALAAIPKEAADQLREVESEKLNRIEKALRPLAEAGDVKAAFAFEKVSASRRKMLGLDAPVRIAGADGGALKLSLDGDLRQQLLDRLFGAPVAPGGGVDGGPAPGDGGGGGGAPPGSSER